MLLSWSKGALCEPLNATLSLEDMYDLVEVMTIDAHNDRIIDKRNREREAR